MKIIFTCILEGKSDNEAEIVWPCTENFEKILVGRYYKKIQIFLKFYECLKEILINENFTYSNSKVTHLWL